MRPFMCAMVLCVGLCGTSAAASHGQGKGGKHAHQGGPPAGEMSATSVDVHVAFGSADVSIIRHHYASRFRNLPPGLQKKVARGGALPPGWQKRFEPFPRELEHRLSRVPAGYTRGVIDGRAVIFDSRTHVIVDIAVLF